MNAHLHIALALCGTAAAYGPRRHYCPPHVCQTVSVDPNSKADMTLFSGICEVDSLTSQVHVDTDGGDESMVDVFNYPIRAQDSASIITPYFVDATANISDECKGGLSSVNDVSIVDVENYFAKLSNGNIVGVMKRSCPGNNNWQGFQQMFVLLDAKGAGIDANPVSDPSTDTVNRVAVSAMKGDHVALAMIHQCGSKSCLSVRAFEAPSATGWPGDGKVGQQSESKQSDVDHQSAIDVVAVSTGEVVVTYCLKDNVRFFKKVFPTEEVLFTRQDSQQIQCNGQEAVIMKGVPGSSRFWIMSTVSSVEVPPFKPTGFKSDKATTVSLYDVASKKVIRTITLGYSYVSKSNMAIVTAPNGRTLFVFEESGPDNIAFAIVDADGNIVVEDRNTLMMVDTESTAAVAYDDNTFGIFMVEDESEHCFGFHIDDTGFKLSPLFNCDDRYGESGRTRAAFPDGDKHTMIFRTYTGTGTDNQHNVVALNGYRGYLHVSRKKASPGKATVFNYSPKKQKVSVCASTPSKPTPAPTPAPTLAPMPADPCAAAPTRLYSAVPESPAGAGVMQTWIFPLFGVLGFVSFILWVFVVSFLAAGWRPWDKNAPFARTLSQSRSADVSGSDQEVLLAA